MSNHFLKRKSLWALGLLLVFRSFYSVSLSCKVPFPVYQDDAQTLKHSTSLQYNFPILLDSYILKAKPIIQNDGLLLYSWSGAINGKSGHYQMEVDKNTRIIYSRRFIETEK